MQVYRTILNAGIYDLLHQGHLNLLKKMRSMGDKNIIVLHDDLSCYKIKDRFPVQDLQRRKWQLEKTGLVDEIIITKSTDPAQEFKQAIKNNEEVIYVRGDDLTKDFPGKWLLGKKNIPIIFLPYTEGISSSKIRETLWN